MTQTVSSGPESRKPRDSVAGPLIDSIASGYLPADASVPAARTEPRLRDDDDSCRKHMEPIQMKHRQPHVKREFRTARDLATLHQHPAALSSLTHSSRSFILTSSCSCASSSEERSCVRRVRHVRGVGPLTLSGAGHEHRHVSSAHARVCRCRDASRVRINPHRPTIRSAMGRPHLCERPKLFDGLPPTHGLPNRVAAILRDKSPELDGSSIPPTLLRL